MNILSLFDGMGCAKIALKKLGIEVNKYYSSEIDTFAIKQVKHNFPEAILLGDVTKVKAKDLDKIDLLVGGSPCQGFSFAGKMLNFNDPRSALFFEFVRIWREIKEINPNAKFLLENVNMKKEHMLVISQHLGVFPVNINSNLVSAQNRNRWYWTNIRTKEVGVFKEIWTDIPQPEDKGILLKDILQPKSEINDKYYLSDNGIERINRSNNGDRSITLGNKAIPLMSGYAKMGRDNQYIAVKNAIKEITNPIIYTKNYIQLDISGKGYKSQQDRFFYPETKHGALAAANASDKNGVVTNYKLRRLTPTECSRLQTIPDWYEWVVSDTQIYKMLGNGFTVDIIAHILSFLKDK